MIAETVPLYGTRPSMPSGTSFSALYVRTRATPTDSTEVVFANVADGSLR